MLKPQSIRTPDVRAEIAIIAIVALIVRLIKFKSMSVWHNEAVSVAIAQLSWSDFLSRVIFDPISSLYYLLLKIWTIPFGIGVPSIRGLSILLGILVAIATYTLVKQIFNDNKIALLSGVLVALSPLHTQFSQSAQGYMLAILLTLLSCIWLLRALETNTYKSWLIYAILTTLMLYSDLLLLVVLISQIIFVAVSDKSLKLLPTFGIIVSLLLSIPLIWSIPAYVSNSDLVIPTFWRSVDIFWQSMFGGYGTNRMVEMIGLIVSLASIAFFYLKYKEAKRLLITLLLPLTLIFSLLLFPRIDSNLPSTLLLTSILLSICLSGAILRVSTRGLRQGLIGALILFTLFITYRNWLILDADSKPGMAAAVSYINDTARAEDYMFAANPRMFFSMKYYNQTNMTERLFAPGHENYPGEELLTEDDTAADFSYPQSNNNAWVVWSRGFDGSKPVVPGNWELITERFYPDAPDYKGLVVVSYYHVK